MGWNSLWIANHKNKDQYDSAFRTATNWCMRSVLYVAINSRNSKWVCSSNGRVIPSQGIGNGIDARLIQLFFFFSFNVPLTFLTVFIL